MARPEPFRSGSRLTPPAILVVAAFGLASPGAAAEAPEDALNRARALAEESLASARSTGDRAGEAEALETLGDLAMDRTLYSDAEARYEEAQAILVELGDPERIAAVLADLGMALRQQTRYSEALAHYREALALQREAGDREAVGDRMNNIGVVLELMGDYEGSLAAHRESLEIDREAGDLGGVSTSLYNVGEIYRELGDLPRALDHFRDALRLDEELGSESDAAHSHTQIARTLLEFGEVDAARDHAVRGRDIFRRLEAPRNVAWAQSVLAGAEAAAGRRGLAEELFRDALPLARESGSVSLVTRIRIELAQLALARNETEEALRQARTALEEARATGEKNTEESLYGLLTEIYEARGDPAAALAALREQKRLHDEIIDEARARTIAEMQSQVEFVRKQQRIELLEKEQQLREVEIARQRVLRNTWIAGLLATFLVAFLSYGRYSQAKLNRKLTLQVAERTRELREKHLELEGAYSQLEEISLTDSLTGLRNRRFLLQHLEPDLAKSRREYEDWCFGRGPRPEEADVLFLLLDLDRFKEVNDQYGHAAGDAVLIQVKELMEKVFRSSDYLVRWGGEEFLAVVRFADRSSAPRFAERMRQAVAQHRFDVGRGLTLAKSCSIGWAAYPFEPRRPAVVGWQTVVDIADACLYAAKATSRNAWLGVERSEAGGDAEENEAWSGADVSQAVRDRLAAGGLCLSTSIDPATPVVWS